MKKTDGKDSSPQAMEGMNVRRVHAAIWREEAEPSEATRRMPLLVKVFYVAMTLWFINYLLMWMGPLDWNEFESSPIERVKRDDPAGGGELR